MASHNCPNARGHLCPYPGPYQGKDYATPGVCAKACVDSWDGDHAFERKGDRWVWSGGQHSVEFVVTSS